ncbi:MULTISPECIES: LysR family transcriptional regulator [Asaia]|uniref:LysR family transcriptional regulator n=2 Tax=Asaia bogorensis TaxID=91915 RepID=A0AAN4R3W9_9PROT|nr:MULTISPECIES: LysR family transcriptional regulator [Asaia]ETC97289.1 LysR family transcriptional regulator [Asaia sp. SF2.1]MDL2170873.1 LysR family transcriptional regulator [Asaia sp. HumB]CDG39067.1 LysR family transcription regulatory protein [Asaia bogorensis]BAT20894.1 transcriptional regulator LysR [Asaia bogorensis NBRC 16594]GBQ76835.1 transcriptional regulator [Asaia bogorensis NBRC 16594]
MSPKPSGDPFSGIRIFIATVQEGSFAKAATRLGLTKSAIGKSLQRLETRLNTELFYRSSRGVSLTGDGEIFYNRCKVAHDELEQGEMELLIKTCGPTGTVRIDMPASYGRNVVMPILIDQMNTHPGLRIIATFNDRIIDPLQGSSHLTLRFGLIRDTHDLVARRMTTQALILCASPSYLANYGMPATIADLDRHRCLVGFSDHASPRWAVRTENGTRGYYSPLANHQIGDGDAILQAALAGCGLCQLPEFMVNQAIAAGTLVPLLPALSLTIPVNLIWPATCRLPSRVRHVIDVLKATLPERKTSQICS